MKKVLTVLLVLSLVLTAVFANGGKEKSTEAMELVIYNGGTDAEGQKMIDAFTAKYPNIKVTQVQDKSANITTRVLQGEEADVVTLIGKENLDDRVSDGNHEKEPQQRRGTGWRRAGKLHEQLHS